MPTYLHPGVYIEEIPSGARPIEGVATSVAAFVGAVRRGPTDRAVLVHSWDEYAAAFGQIASPDDAMGLSVSAFYSNGGKDAYIGRLVGATPPAATAAAPVAGENTGGAAVVRVSAESPGEWGNELRFRILKDAPGDLAFTLEVGHVEGEELVVDERYADVDMNARSEAYVLQRVNGVSGLVQVSLEDAADPDVSGNALARGSVTGAVMPTGADVFSGASGIADGMTMRLNVDDLGVRRITLGSRASLELEGDNAADGARVAAAIAAAVAALGPTAPAYADFTCTYGGDRRFVLTSGTQSSYSSVTVLAGDGSATDLARFIRVDPASNPVVVRGSVNVIPQASAGTAATVGTPLIGGAEVPPTAADYTTFFTRILRKIHDASIIVLPGESMPADGSGNPVIDAAIAHCEDTKSRMAVIDPPPGVELDQAATVGNLQLTTSTYAALYYPWVRTANPFYNVDTNPTAPPTLTIAPSGFAAGMWAKIDGRRGVWKAPAGVETALLGAAGLEYTVGDADQDQLNPLGVNCLREQPGFGRVIWGARTLSTRAAPEWRYVPVRRTAIFIEQSIYNGIQWAVFEPNDHLLWASLRVNVDSFMGGLFRSNAFQGEKASDAYFVRCGLGDTMTQGDIDRGQVIVIVGFAPLKPAEFVIVRIQQKVGQQ